MIIEVHGCNIKIIAPEEGGEWFKVDSQGDIELHAKEPIQIVAPEVLIDGDLKVTGTIFYNQLAAAGGPAPEGGE